jgi:hypothetical protein
VAGCIKKTVTEDKAVYTYELWVPIGVALAGVVLLVGGFLLLRRSAVPVVLTQGMAKSFFYMAILTVVVPPVLWVFAWSMVGDALTVENDQFNLYRHSILGGSNRVVPFESLGGLEFRRRETVEHGRSKIHYEMVYHWKMGGEEVTPVGDLLKAGLDDILDRARQHGIPIIRPDNRPH